MRSGTSIVLLAAMLVASPLAHAQRASLADRVAALEQRAVNDQGGTELVNQISRLRSEVQDLRGQIEVLQQQLEQARQGQRSQYLDLDGRLNRLEGGASAASPEPATSPPSSAASTAARRSASARSRSTASRCAARTTTKSPTSRG